MFLNENEQESFVIDRQNLYYHIAHLHIGLYRFYYT